LVVKCKIQGWNWNLLVATPCLGGAWVQRTSDFVSIVFFFLFLFFSLSSSISTLKTSIFQSNYSICFSFKFCSFLLLFVLFEIIYKIRIVFQFHPLLIFNLSYLVPVLFVAIFYPFFSLVFNCIPRCFISFNFYTRFDHYYFDCYLFCFLSLDDWEFYFVIYLVFLVRGSPV
jgi:hypothetical protein